MIVALLPYPLMGSRPDPFTSQIVQDMSRDVGLEALAENLDRQGHPHLRQRQRQIGIANILPDAVGVKGYVGSRTTSLKIRPE